MPRYWDEASSEELVDRVNWLETELAVALALLKAGHQTPVSEGFIAKADTLRRAGPDDPVWLSRAEAAH